MSLREIFPLRIILTVTRKQSWNLIEKKRAGEKIVMEEAPHPEQAKELMQALQETIATLEMK